MSLINVGAEAVDPCDIALIATHGDGSLVLIGDGVALLDDTDTATLAGEVNDGNAAGPLLFELTDVSGYTGIVYVSGAQVVRVQEANNGDGATLALRNGPPLYTLTTKVGDVVDLVNATAQCSGGAGGASLTFVGEWNPILTETSGTATAGTPGTSFATRQVQDEFGLWDLSAVVVVQQQVNGSPVIDITGLPATISSGQANGVLYAQVFAGPSVGIVPAVLGDLPDNNTIRLTFNTAMQSGDVTVVNLRFRTFEDGGS